MPPDRHLSRLTSPEVGELAAAGAVLVVPVGSTEQHGPHLALGTDADVAVELCERLATRRTDVVLAPLVPYGSSGEHAGFPGTLSIGQEAVELLLLELGRSAGETFSRQVLVSAHGGNAVPATRAVRRLRAESRDVLLWMPRWDGDAHAGRTETSLQLAMRPDGVRAELAEAGATGPLRDLLPAMTAGGVRAVSPNGVLGDPAGASAGEGERLLAALVDDLDAAVTAWEAAPLGAQPVGSAR